MEMEIEQSELRSLWMLVSINQFRLDLRFLQHSRHLVARINVPQSLLELII